MKISLGDIKMILDAITEHDGLQRTILGTYTNGDARSLLDAINGELLSPEDRLLIEDRIRKIKKRNKKNGKKKKKNKFNIDIDD